MYCVYYEGAGFLLVYRWCSGVVDLNVYSLLFRGKYEHGESSLLFGSMYVIPY